MNLPVGPMKDCLHTGNQMWEVQVVTFQKTIAIQSFGQLTEPEEVSRFLRRRWQQLQLFYTKTQHTGDGGEDHSSEWKVREMYMAVISASDLLGFLCISLILRPFPLFLMIIFLAPGHSYRLFSYYFHWQSNCLFKR